MTERKVDFLNIVLTGMMGSGKTVVGKKLAEELGYHYIDTDEMIEKDVGYSINEIFEKDGEKSFRELEKKAVKCVSLLDKHVIATGGGVVKNSENMDELEKNSYIICLKADAATLYQRLKREDNRPLLKVADPEKKLEELLKKRAGYYKRCHYAVDTRDKNIREVVEEIKGFIKDNVN
ncbi:MAG: shikimate kinase [Elusimicrobiota bacterium]